MKIEDGEYYRTRDGRKVGPAKRERNRFEFEGSWLLCHESDGTYCGRNAADRDLDIIAKWAEGPVRTVTRREVVEGRYGIVRVDTHRDQVVISIDPSDGHNATPEKLKAAAAVLLELAGALDSE